MKAWIKKEVAPDVMDPAKEYFLCKRWEGPHGHVYHSFYSRGLNGKLSWTSKPGIACRYSPQPAMSNVLSDNPGSVFVEVPADADKRWRARKPVSSFSRHR